MRVLVLGGGPVLYFADHMHPGPLAFAHSHITRAVRLREDRKG